MVLQRVAVSCRISAFLLMFVVGMGCGVNVLQGVISQHGIKALDTRPKSDTDVLVPRNENGILQVTGC